LTTYISAIAMKDSERWIAFIHAIILAIVCILSNNPYHTAVYATIIGVIMALAEYICIMYGMWEYKKTEFTIPIWLPFTWAIVAVFASDVYTFTKRYL